ncbi:DNA polymerase zeta catalytic subunit isoform X1 [Senna tora]|uniref:DNA polymerase zeta catalytic subunit isoform X1 n=1 Tax=Senna tora TaxID=362788 RepID=A0A834TIE0_9FABA|nr:DNA polymerase zeta catalytic subunit isoform X1 [Senna tora]
MRASEGRVKRNNCSALPYMVCKPDQEGGIGSTGKHVHGCILLHIWVDIAVAQDVSSSANLLLAGAVLGKSSQPYESHIPFILQFLIQMEIHVLSQQFGHLARFHLIGRGNLQVNWVFDQIMRRIALNVNWREHQERTGIYESTMPPDPGKPLPEHVLKNLSASFVYLEKKILELRGGQMKPYENPVDVNTASGIIKRRDLLPDAWFDAINIVALGFQNDSDTITIIELLCGFKLLYSRSFDALLGCEVLVFTHEKD